MKQLAADQETTLGGMFTQIALKNTQKARNGNSRYFLARIEDMTGSAKCVMWPDDFARCKEEIRDDVPYIIKGTVDRRREEPTLVINRILTLEQAQRELARGLYLLLRLGRTEPEDIDRLRFGAAAVAGTVPGVSDHQGRGGQVLRAETRPRLRHQPECISARGTGGDPGAEQRAADVTGASTGLLCSASVGGW